MPEKPSFTIGKLEPRSIVTEMQESYLDYAMSVIIARALPDVRDGLKPVHRRILYAMWDMGLKSGAKFRKSATVVGEVLGKYHPHGDVAVYDSMVRMAQDFALRYPLIWGQGNFGSLDGDSAAAMRYCVTGDTRIVTERGLEEIGSLAQKEDISLRILSANREVNQANKWFASGAHPTLRITTGKGYQLTGSYNHPILTWVKDDNGQVHFVWKRLDQLKIGDIAVLDRSGALWTKKESDLRPYVPKQWNRKVQIKQLPTCLNEDFAFILGSLGSEGSIGQHEIEFCNTNMEWVDEFQVRWKRVFPDCRLHIFKRQPSSYGKKPYTRLEIHSRYVIAFLRNCGLLPVKSPKRTIPHLLFSSPKRVVAAFLQTYFEGDGSISESSTMVELSCNSASPVFIQELQLLLLRFGIDTFRRLDKQRGMHKVYIRNVHNYARFKSEIGFFSKRKMGKLDAVLERFTKQSSKTDYVPFLSDMVRGFWKDERPPEIISKHNFDRYDRLCALQKTVITAVAEKTQIDLNPLFLQLLANRYLFEPIISIEYTGVQEVFSIRVESKCHSFIGNGFVNHNTEAKLAAIAEEMLFDIEKETISFIPNYDGAHKEPQVLPARLPNLLLNGTMGIAVGMATNIPPHNLTELCDALIHLIDCPDCSIEDLLQFVTGPDFPTGGIIYDKEAIRQAYATGRGSVVIRGKAAIEEGKGGMQIIVTEIPYNVNKADLISRMADLVHEKKLEGIKDIRDESNREGVRINIELKRDAYPKKVLNQLYATTSLQDAFHFNMLALVDGIQPRVLNLKSILEEYLKHRAVVVRRRIAFDLARAKERAHILEGLKTAIMNIDKVIATIKKSQDRDEAKINLIKQFKLTEIQAVAILEMRLQQLANLERLKVETELKEKQALIKELETILASNKRIQTVIKNEVLEIKKQYSDERRTQVVPHSVKEFSVEDLIPDEPTIVIITRDNYIKRVAPESFRTQGRGGKGVMGLMTKEEDVVEHLFSTTTHADLLFFTTRGRIFKLKAHEIPPASRTAKGQALVNFLQLAPQEKVSAVLSLKELGDYKYLVMVTRDGLIKKTDITDFEVVRHSGLIALKLKGDDLLKWVKPSNGSDDVMLITAKGQSIRFKEKDVRAMGRAAAGVKGIRLKGRDYIVGMDIVDPEMIKKNLLELFVIMENGFGKRTNLKSYKVQHRSGSGIKTAKVTAKTGEIVSAYVSNAKDERDLIIISTKGQVIRLPFNTVSVLGRATQGVRLMRFKEEGDGVASVTFV